MPEMQPSMSYCKVAGSRGLALRLALNAKQEQGASELVLDLRDNRGGLVSEGVEVARLFLDGALQLVSRLSAR